jgi:hypothetical protein
VPTTSGLAKSTWRDNTLETLIETEPSFPEAWYHWGQTLEALGAEETWPGRPIERALELEFHGLTTIRPEQVEESSEGPWAQQRTIPPKRKKTRDNYPRNRC